MAKFRIKYFVVDAFTDSIFRGNPAAVCLLEDDKDDEWLQSVAGEFNLSETCYLTQLEDSGLRHFDSSYKAGIPKFHLRWFTPAKEVKLCGHATLAAAYALFVSRLEYSDEVEFFTHSGTLKAKRVREEEGKFSVALDFPAIKIESCAELSSIHEAINGASVVDIKKSEAGDIIVELPSETSVYDFKPPFDAIERLPGRGLIITALASQDSKFDFCSRFFSPQYGIREDPVCGSAHCALAPYWSSKLGKCSFVAYQASSRGGILHLELEKQKERVILQGKGVMVMEGFLLV